MGGDAARTGAWFGLRPDAASHPLGRLWDQLALPRRDQPALLALYRRLKNGADGAPAGDSTCSVLEVLDSLVQYRNAVFGHGAARFDSFYEQVMGPLLFPAVNELLAEGTLDPLGPRGSKLVYLTEVRTLGDGRVEVGLRELVGLPGERTAPLHLRPDQAEGLVPGRVGLLWPGRRVPLLLHPLLVYRENEVAVEVLFLNRDRNRKQVEYLSYTTGRTERDREMAPALADLLGRITGKPIGEADLEALAEQSFSQTPSIEALFASPGPERRRLGDYEILAELGRGGMGVVYLARQLSLGRLVALKTLPADLAGDAGALARFHREIQVLARCEHPHIVKVLSSGDFPRRPDLLHDGVRAGVQPRRGVAGADPRSRGRAHRPARRQHLDEGGPSGNPPAAGAPPSAAFPPSLCRKRTPRPTLSWISRRARASRFPRCLRTATAERTVRESTFAGSQP